MNESVHREVQKVKPKAADGIDSIYEHRKSIGQVSIVQLTFL